MELRIMTYNILHGADYARGRREGRETIDLAGVAAIIRSIGADVCGLNEVRGSGKTVGYTAQADAIGANLGFQHVFGRSILVHGTEPYGNGLVSRYPIRDTEVIPIPDPMVCGVVPPEVESRSILRCVLAMPENGKTLTVFATHFGLTLPERENAAVLAEKLFSAETGPAVLIGDFNTSPHEPVLRSLRQNFRTVGDLRVCTYPADKPDVRIDYIFLNRFVTLRRHGIGPRSSSDHFPIWADIAF